MTDNPAPADAGSTRNKSRLYSIIRAAAPWIATVAIFYFIFRKVPFAEVNASLGLMNPVVFIPVVIVAFGVFLVFDVFAYNLVFNWLVSKTTFREVFVARGASFILGAVNFMAGQGGIGYWLAKKKNVPVSDALSAVFFIIFMDFFEVIFMCAFGVAVLLPGVSLGDLFGDKPESHFMRVTFITMAVLLFQIFVWTTKPKIPVIGTLLFKGPFSVFHKLKLKHFAITFAIKTTAYTLEFAITWIALRSFGVETGLMQVFTYLPVIYLIGAIPVTAFGLGTTQAAWLYFFKGAAAEAVLLAFALSWSFFTIIVMMGSGAVCLALMMRSEKKVSKTSA